MRAPFGACVLALLAMPVMAASGGLPADPPAAAETSTVGSPRHCANLMDPDFTAMGIGFAADTKSAAGINWSQLFGTPRP